MKGRTSIVIAHHLSTIRHVDQILVLHHGQVRERGRHEELIKLGGIYSQLYQLNYGMGEEERGSCLLNSGYYCLTFGCTVITRIWLASHKRALSASSSPLNCLAAGLGPSSTITPIAQS